MTLASFSLGNIFWYYLLYGLATWFVMRFIPKNKRQKILTPVQDSGSSWNKTASALAMIFRMAAMILSFFVPITPNRGMLCVGTAFCGIGIVLSTLANAY